MDETRRDHKAYTVYRAGDAGTDEDAQARDAGDVPAGGAAPAGRTAGRRHTRAQRTRRRRQGLLLAGAALALVVAALSLATVKLFAGGDGDAGTGGAAAGTVQPAGGGASASPSAEPSAAPSPPRFTITAGGDVIGGFGVAGQLQQSGTRVLKAVAPWLKKADFGFVNLESPITVHGDPQTWKDVIIKGDPLLAPVMAKSGINVVTMANNHAGDQGDSGLLDTFEAAQDHDITVVGAGKDLKRAMTGAVERTDAGVKVAFLGFTDVLPVGYPATNASPGVAPGRADQAAVEKAIAKAAGRADFVVVGWHWNFEYKTAPSALETQEGRAAIDAGADVVFAHHPHVLNGVERYRDGLIFYSLGNLLFSGWSGETAETMIVSASVTPKRIYARLIPVLLSPAGLPTVAKGDDAERILGRVRRLSADLGTTVAIEDGYGWVRVRR